MKRRHELTAFSGYLGLYKNTGYGAKPKPATVAGDLPCQVRQQFARLGRNFFILFKARSDRVIR